LLDTTPVFRLDAAEFKSLVREVIDPLGQVAAGDRAGRIYQQLSLQFLALANLNELVSSTRRSRDWWEWARESLVAFVDLEEDSGGDHGEGFDLPVYLNGACSTLVLMFGLGLDARTKGVLPGPMKPPPGHRLAKGGASHPETAR